MGEFLPPIGGVSYGMVLAVILEILKAVFGLHENKTPWVALILGVIWSGAVIAMGYWPLVGDWVTVIIRIILLLVSVPLGAKLGYAGLVKPLARKRWNTADRHVY